MDAPGTYACSHQLAGRAPQGAGPEPGSCSDDLHVAELKASHQSRTQERAEGRFIALHHTAELLFSRQNGEPESTIMSFHDREPDVPAALPRLGRMHDLDWGRRRAQHALMVEAMIGTAASGAGGTDGSRFLWARVQTRFYPILHKAASLNHRHRAMAS